MSINNRIITNSWTPANITSETIADVWDFYEAAFTGYEGVTFNRDTTNTVMTVYFDTDEKMSMSIGLKDTTGVSITYKLGSEVCSYTESSGSSSNVSIAYLRTAYGVAWGISAAPLGTSDFENLINFFTLKTTPSLVLGAGNATSASNTHYILSPLHDIIEVRAETSVYLSTTLAQQRFDMCNAHSCDVDLNIKHLFRVLGKPSSSYPLGSVRNGSKNVFWCGRYALEFDE